MVTATMRNYGMGIGAIYPDADEIAEREERKRLARIPHEPTENPMVLAMLRKAEEARLEHERIMRKSIVGLDAYVLAVSTGLIRYEPQCTVCNGEDACNLASHAEWVNAVRTAFAWTYVRLPHDEREDWIGTLTMRLLELRPTNGKLLFGIARRLLGIWIFDRSAWTSHSVSLDDPVQIDEDGDAIDSVDVVLGKQVYREFQALVFGHGDTRRRPQGRNGAIRSALSEAEMATLVEIDARAQVNSKLKGRGHKAGAEKLTNAEKQKAYRLRSKAQKALTSGDYSEYVKAAKAEGATQTA